MRRRSILQRGSCRLWSSGLATIWRHPALAEISLWYSGLEGRLPTCYSPVRHSAPKSLVRLACIRHAAGVYPEPGSNSQIWFIEVGLAADFMIYFKWLYLLQPEITNPVYYCTVLLLFTNLWIDVFLVCMYWSSRSVFKERSYALFYRANKILSFPNIDVNNYFMFFQYCLW